MNTKFIRLLLIALTFTSTAMLAAYRQETTIFHKAATWNNHKSLLQLMVSNNNPAELNALDSNGWTPLHHAVFGDNRVYLELLLAYGADVYAPTNEDGTLRDYAADFKDQYTTALHLAVRAGNLACAVILINAGANVNAQDWNGTTPLHEAAYRGQRACVEMLLERDAECTLVTHHHQTADCLAAQAGHHDIAKLLRQEREKKEAEQQHPLEHKEPSWWSFLCF